jgi:putative transposase
MAHNYTNLLTHVIFSTKERASLIDTELRPQLFPYMIGIVRELGGNTLAVNGTADHLHMLVALPPSLSVADAMRVLKTNPSRWVHEKWVTRRTFGWQSGYGAFSVSQSGIGNVIKYIKEQEAHHRRVTFQAEFLAFLKRHGIEYDERYLWA